LVFKLNTIDEDFALAVQAALKHLGYPSRIYKHDVSKSSKPNYSLWCGSEEICKMLRLVTKCKSQIPDMDRHVTAVIEGLMDSEGFVAANSNPTNRRYYMGFKSCDAWVPELIRLMQSVGLKIGKIQTERPRKPGYKAPTRFHINMQSWVDSGLRFNIKRKQDRVDVWASSGAYTQRKRFPRKLTSETTRQTA